MKLIHCADLHIGKNFSSLPQDVRGVMQRSLIDNFVSMMRFAHDNAVDVVMISGDFFDRAKVAISCKKEVLGIVSSFPHISVIYLKGNHDALAEFDDELVVPSNLLIVPNNEEDDWTYYRYEEEGVTIAAIDLNSQYDASFYERLVLHKDNFNIVMMHGMTKAITEGGQFERVVDLNRLRNKNVDYLALGDIHIPDYEVRKLDNRGHYAYSGSLTGTGFDEIGERGFFLLEAEQNKLTRSFARMTKRQFRIIDVDITHCDTHSKIYSQVDFVLDKLRRNDFINDLLRINLIGKYEASTIKDLENLALKLNEEFFFAEVKDSSTLDVSSINCHELSLKSKFASLVLRDTTLTKEEQDKILEFGIKALQRETL
ncbi:MAG: metallophosphoesterase [Firmicutes bacterium]|nr:metallophosphoesterase [Bacillota bacterium]